ncbi:MAG: IS110 family transposase [Chloroflexota bacterium]|nr:IS110 family transposase [Chloroflexota bacterium]
MDVIHERCCGLDVHKRTVVACLLTPGQRGQPGKEVRPFGTMTADVQALAEWLAAAGCTHVAMEGTGVYWKPIWNLLEDRFALLLVNARHVKAVPGRKTDVKDAEWLADLLRHGLLAASYVPDRDQRELRELTRSRTTLLRERAAEANRLQKTLEGANLKLAAVATDITGKSGRAILRALVDGETDPARLAELAQGRLREKLPALRQALAGRVGAHQRFLVAQQLDHLAFLDARIEQVSAEIAERTRPCADAIARLDAIPGVGQRTAEVLVAEVGTEMGRFPTPGHLASWAGMCPGNHQSAGQHKSGRTRKGSPWLRGALAEAAQAAARTKGSYLQAQYRRLAARRGKQRAIIAVGHTILRMVYHLLKRPDSVYEELGAHYFDERDRQAIERRLVRRLERLGYQVALEPIGAT